MDSFRHLILPAIALGDHPAGHHRPHHALEPARRPGPRLRAHGAREGPRRDRTVVMRHALRNAMLPVVTIIGLQVGILLGGAILTETIFNLAGVGQDGLRRHHGAGLRGHPGLHAHHRHRVHPREPDRRHLLRLARPAHPDDASAIGRRDTHVVDARLADPSHPLAGRPRARRGPMRHPWRQSHDERSCGSARLRSGLVLLLVLLLLGRLAGRCHRPVSHPNRSCSASRTASSRGRRPASTSWAARRTSRST